MSRLAPVAVALVLAGCHAAGTARHVTTETSAGSSTTPELERVTAEGEDGPAETDPVLASMRRPLEEVRAFFHADGEEEPLEYGLELPVGSELTELEPAFHVWETPADLRFAITLVPTAASLLAPLGATTGTDEDGVSWARRDTCDPSSGVRSCTLAVEVIRATRGGFVACSCEVAIETSPVVRDELSHWLLDRCRSLHAPPP